MRICIDVLADETIEIMRADAPEDVRFLRFSDLDSSMRVIKWLVKRKVEKVRRERFVPELDRECRRELAKHLKGEGK